MDDIAYNSMDMQVSYLAGIFDGEGAISVLYSKANRQWYLPLAKITMANREIPEMFYDLFEGSLRVEGPYYIWTLTGPKLEGLCRQLVSHVIIKKRHIEIASELLSTFGGLRGKNITDAVLNKRRALVDELRSLQMKGRDIYTDSVDRVNDYAGSI